ncbi:hypothetical protein BDU57DRAFT_326501 [Ampelomyces quisqualis]|uniref:Uncharacterized protein n=1 Tax=Ampelomyces quisqualis TaxID=50730 RepID=A0A6A5QGF0_AMPQU|nr:hypothetical protein BDU57DRAFT_326501 [Ampelomyces quisqualis]
MKWLRKAKAATSKYVTAQACTRISQPFVEMQPKRKQLRSGAHYFVLARHAQMGTDGFAPFCLAQHGQRTGVGRRTAPCSYKPRNLQGLRLRYDVGSLLLVRVLIRFAHLDAMLHGGAGKAWPIEFPVLYFALYLQCSGLNDRNDDLREQQSGCPYDMVVFC